MQKSYHLLIIDITGIQDYLFSTNKLKENVGASEIVKNIFEDILKENLNKISICNYQLDDWKENYNEFHILKENVDYEIGYIGGGNALIIFKNDRFLEEFKRNWSKDLLIKAPGVSISFSSIEVEKFEGTEFQGKYKKLFEGLRKNKFKYSANVLIPEHGITATCSRSGNTQEVFIKDKDESKYVSSMIKGKLEGYKNSSYRISQKVNKLFGKEMSLYEDFDKLQEDGNSHIAIIHIDGNGIGKIFQKCSSLSEVRKNSCVLELVFNKSFDALLEKIKLNLENILDSIGAKNKNILPIRSLVIGGDDITFICPGKLSFYFTEIFLEELLKNAATELKSIIEDPFSICAGIAITKIGYPFYKGYKLAEDACQLAKDERKEKKDNGSWIDFHIQYGSLVGELKQIREQYKVPSGNLLARPYKFTAQENSYEYTYNDLKQNSFLLSNFASNKIHRFRDVLYKNKSYLDSFKREMEGKEENWNLFNFKGISEIFNSDNSDEATTYFFDMIEFIEFYPKFLYEKGKKHNHE